MKYACKTNDNKCEQACEAYARPKHTINVKFTSAAPDC